MNSCLTPLLAIILGSFVFLGVAQTQQTENEPTPQFDFEITPSDIDQWRPELPVASSKLIISEQVIHRTGLFQVPLPEGDWTVYQNFGDTYDPQNNRADLIIHSGEHLVVVQITLQLTLRREGNRVHLMQRVKSSAQCPQIKFRF